MFSERGEAGGIGAGCVRDANDAFVAGHFAALAELAFDEPERGVQGEKHEAEFLQKVGPVVAAAEMFRLVENDLVEFAGCEAREEPIGNKDAGREEADDAGAVDVRRGADLKAAARDAGWGEIDGGGGTPERVQAEGMEKQVCGARGRCEEPNGGDDEGPAGIELEPCVGSRDCRVRSVCGDC